MSKAAPDHEGLANAARKLAAADHAAKKEAALSVEWLRQIPEDFHETNGMADTRLVVPGALWHVRDTDCVVLVMTALVDEPGTRIFNCAFWPAGGPCDTIPGDGAQAGLVNADQLATTGECIALPLEGLVEMINGITREVHEAAQAVFDAREKAR